MDKKALCICVVGLGYVGLPLAIEFAKKGVAVKGFDKDKNKIDKLKNGIDLSGQFSEKELSEVSIEYSDDENIISKANFIIIAVPTPVDHLNGPDLKYVISASSIVGSKLTKGSYVVYESTVYPGVTEEVCLPILEKESSLRNGVDFFLGYSPERVNPGDQEHTIDRIVKVVSGQDEQSAKHIAAVYSIAIEAGVHVASNIKTAEASKVIENVQRDINIAFVNEITLIFEKLGINVFEVLEAAGTKWNFHKYTPGLVGGHCIGVDPYYLVYRAQEVGYSPELILAARKVNEAMSTYVAEKLIKVMIKANKTIKHSRVLIMGLTFKEDVRDIRNSKAKDIISFLQSYDIEVLGYEPHAEKEEIQAEFGVENLQWDNISDIDAVILFNGHKDFRKISVPSLKSIFKNQPILFDIKNFFDKETLEKNGFLVNSL